MYQCIENTREGDSVQFENKMYRVQNDKGWLFIYPTVNGKRIKIGIDRILYNAGIEQDYVFSNGYWFLEYDFNTYQSFAKAELSWVIRNN